MLGFIIFLILICSLFDRPRYWGYRRPWGGWFFGPTYHHHHGPMGGPHGPMGGFHGPTGGFHGPMGGGFHGGGFGGGRFGGGGATRGGGAGRGR